MGSTRFQDGKAAWRFLAPTGIDSQTSTAIAQVVVRIVKVASRSALRLRNCIKPTIPVGYVSKVRIILIAGEFVVPTFMTSGIAGLQRNGNCRLLGATGLRRQPILKVNPLKVARNLNNLTFGWLEAKSMIRMNEPQIKK